MTSRRTRSAVCPARRRVSRRGDARCRRCRRATGRQASPAHGVVDERGISADGDRIFFDTPTPLVPQDTNTELAGDRRHRKQFEPQGRDVYEWENGVVYLISGGKSPRDSYLLDNSENGDDVFFATTEGLVAGRYRRWL